MASGEGTGMETVPGDPAQEPERHPPQINPGLPACDELALSVERRALLAPKLQVLLADFQQLAALEQPDLEPAFGRADPGEAADATR